MAPIVTKPEPKKEKKLPIPLIVVSAVAVLSLVGFFFRSSQLTKLEENSTHLGTTVFKVARAVETNTVTAAILTDSAALDFVVTNVVERMAELTAARTEIETIKGELADVRTEAAAEMEALTKQKEELKNLNIDLETRTKELADLKKIYDNDTTRLYATIEALNKKIDSLTIVPADAAGEGEEPVESTVAAEVAETKPPAETAAPAVAPAPTGTAAAGTDTNAVAKPPVAVKGQAIAIPAGKSILFKSVRYDETKNKVIFLTLNDQTLTYSDVPAEVFDALIAAPILDIYYRFKILDVFESKPKDRELIRTIRP